MTTMRLMLVLDFPESASRATDEQLRKIGLDILPILEVNARSMVYERTGIVVATDGDVASVTRFEDEQ